MNRNVLALKFLEGEYYVVIGNTGRDTYLDRQLDISVTLLVHYHNLEYHATVAIQSTNPSIDRDYANIFINKEDSLPSMDRLLSEIARIAKQAKLYSRYDNVEVRFYRIGGKVATRKYIVNLK